MKIGIIAAIEEELALLVDSLDNPASITFGQFTYHTGQIRGVEVVLLLCGIGKVNAAVGATLLLDRFKPDCLVNTGVAGGLPPKVSIGDVVVSSEVRHYDADATAFAYEMGQVPQMPVAFKADDKLIYWAGRAGCACNAIQVHHGTIISGDAFVHTPQQLAGIEKYFPNALAVEMEGAAIAQTGFLFKVPFILIRSISDKVSEPSNADMYRASMKNAAINSMHMVLGLIDNIQGEKSAACNKFSN